VSLQSPGTRLLSSLPVLCALVAQPTRTPCGFQAGQAAVDLFSQEECVGKLCQAGLQGCLCFFPPRHTPEEDSKVT
jgi:hypothetical protein